MGNSDSPANVTANKVGAIGDKIHIEKQDLSSLNVSTVNIYNYRGDFDEPKAPEATQLAPIAANPYKGLAHFGPNDSKLFFGRGDIIEKLTKTIRKNRFTSIIGPSGSGKSSLMLAGVAPYLSSEGLWLFSYFRVSDSSINDPFLAMSQALIPYYDKDLKGIEQQVEAKKLAQYLYSGELTLLDVCDKVRKDFPQKRLLLIADQFEELYTTGVTTKTQEKFISLLVNTLNNNRVNEEQPVLSMVVTLRADFLGHAASNAKLATLIDSSSHIIGPMEQTQLREAIEEPARLRNVQFEAGLVDTILEDVGKGHGNLPLVEFTLRLLWEQQENKLISLAAYFALGRVKGALTQHAQGIYQQLDSQEQKTAERVFTQLVKIGSGTEDTRRTALSTDFAPKDWALVQRFANESNRLVVTNKLEGIETAEVVHEALIKHWPLLRQWVNEGRLFLSWLDELRQSMEQWHKHDKDSDSLLRGIALAQAQEWLQNKAEDIPANVQEFIQRSVQRQNKQNSVIKRRHQLQWLAAVAVIVVLAILAGYLNDSRNQQFLITAIAKEATTIADEQRDKQYITQSRFLADLSKQHTEKSNSRLGALLAIEGLPNDSKVAEQRRPFSPEAAVSLYIAMGGYMDIILLKHASAVTHAAFSPDGRRIVTASGSGTVRLWDATSGNELLTFGGSSSDVYLTVFSPDGSQIVTASEDHTVRLWDAASGNELATLTGLARRVVYAIFSPDGSQFVTASEDHTTRVWDATNGGALATLAGLTQVIVHAAFSSDGSKIVIVSNDKTAQVWDVASGKVLVTLTGHIGRIVHAAFSLDGSRIVTVSEDFSPSSDHTARVWDAISGNELTILGHTSYVNHAAFSPDDSRVVTASTDDTARLWDASSGKVLVTLTGHTESVNYAEFNSDGSRILTASDDDTARLWDATSGKVLAILGGHSSDVVRATFSPDGSRILTASADHTTRVWVATSGNELATLGGHTGAVVHATFSPDGSRILTASADKTARVWDVASGNELATLVAHDPGGHHAAFSPDGSRILTIRDTTLRMWDAASGNELAALVEHTDNFRHRAFGPGGSPRAFSPDGSRVLIASKFGSVHLRDTARGKVQATLVGHTDDIILSVFSPDGSRVLTMSRDKTSRVWDTASGNELATIAVHASFLNRLRVSTQWRVDAGKYTVFSPDGSRIVTASGYFSRYRGDTAIVWDAASGNLEATLVGRGPVAFSPDGSRILTASADKIVRLWDAASGMVLATLVGHTHNVNHVAFSPDGSQIVTASKDNTARLWDAASGYELATLGGHTGDVNHAAFSPDGSQIVTSSEDNTARLWKNYSTQELVETAKNLNLPPLTKEERRRNYLD